jgi:pimeloyl-ACP methyl ester carboxylesterase
MLVAALGALALLLLSAGCSRAATRAHRADASAPATLELGSQTLSKCATAPLAYCGSLPVPLDYSSPASPKITIAFRWYPSTATPATEGAVGGSQSLHTVVPVEGGPGYPSIESVSYRSLGENAGYSAMYGKLLERWNLLAVDNRGTGESAPLKCSELQRFAGPTGTDAFRQAAAGCAAALNRHWTYAGGGAVHASQMFGSIPAARDLAAVIGALELPKVDLYGDSYGSFFAQVFAAHFPHLVRSVVLDSTYLAKGLDPWYRSTVQSMPADFDAACARSQACAQAAPGSSWARIGELARLLESPISGRVPGASGAMQQVKMEVVGLVDLVSDAAEDTKIYRELDASARALLGPAHDPAPLLRLYAQREHEDEGYFSLPVSEYSVELYVAVACTDYSQLFDMNASPALRAGELSAAEAALPASTFAPFSTSEWISQNENTEAFSVCLGWPSPDATAETPVTSALQPLPATLPVLVLGGELDAWTPPVDAPKVLAQIGGKAQFVELANSTHVVGEGDTECGSELIQRFVTQPQAFGAPDAACAAAVPPIHTVGSYPAQLAEQAPLQQSPGGGASTEQLQLAAAAVATAGDAIVRYDAIEAKHDRGLAGGTVTAAHEGAQLTLERDELIPGVVVSGTVALTPSAIASDGQTAVATLSVRTAGMPAASLTASWTTAGAEAQAQVLGTIGKQPVAGTMPAP